MFSHSCPSCQHLSEGLSTRQQDRAVLLCGVSNKILAQLVKIQYKIYKLKIGTQYFENVFLKPLTGLFRCFV